MKQMTREQAVHAGATAIAGAGLIDPPDSFHARAETFVIMAETLGLFTPTEPKSVEDEAVEALKKTGRMALAPANVIAVLKEAGFTVTKAVT